MQLGMQIPVFLQYVGIADYMVSQQKRHNFFGYCPSLNTDCQWAADD
jgi:hypothetical protein